MKSECVVGLSVVSGGGQPATWQSATYSVVVTTAVLPQRVAVVTGASRGIAIGKGIVVELGRAGYAVYALGRSSRDMPAAEVERLVAGGQRPVPEGSDLSVDTQLRKRSPLRVGVELRGPLRSRLR